MTVVVSNIRIPIGADQSACMEQAVRRLGVRASDVLGTHIYRRSVDARRRGEAALVYSVAVELADGACPGASADVRALCEPTPELVFGTEKQENRPVVIGFGPAGMFCALLLARNGYRPLVLERGAAMAERVEAVEGFFAGGAFSPVSNVQFGEGGAGTFSDGKLTTRINDPLCAYVLELLRSHGAPDEITVNAKPHIGTDLLRRIVVSVRDEIVSLGGEVRFLAHVEDIELSAGRVASVTAGGERIAAQTAVLAVGHSARDTFAMLRRIGVELQPKPFSVGVRIEHLQSELDSAMYGDLAGNKLLGPAEYQLSDRDNRGRAVYTFCMCPGGVVVPAASEEGGVVTNGMSRHARDGRNANSALAVSVDSRDFGDDPMAGVLFQRGLEQAAFAVSGSFRAPVQTVGRFLEGKPGADFGRVEPSYSIGTTPADLRALFPGAVTERLGDGLRIFGRRLSGFDAPYAVLTAPETRTSSPVRIPRSETGEAVGTAGLYPCGEGCGYAGGIMSAAVDGIRAAQKITAKYKPFD